VTQDEYDNSRGGDIERSPAVDCYCGANCENVKAMAFLVHDKGEVWTDGITFECQVSPGMAMWYRRLWTRIAMAWGALIHGQLIVYWVEGKPKDWHKVAEWLLKIKQVEEPKSEAVHEAGAAGAAAPERGAGA